MNAQWNGLSECSGKLEIASNQKDLSHKLDNGFGRQFRRLSISPKFITISSSGYYEVDGQMIAKLANKARYTICRSLSSPNP